MKNFTLVGLACTTLLTLPQAALAHGGVYRGPRDIVPPNAGGRPTTGGPNVPGPTTPGPTAPGAPGVPGPRTPSGGPPPMTPPGAPPGAGSGRGPMTPGGIVLGDDLSKWQYWWEFNKDPFINLKEAIHAPEAVTGSDEVYLGPMRRRHGVDTAKPSDSDIENVILPALKRAMEVTTSRDILSSCIIAMAKIGRDHTNFEILPLFADALGEHDQEIRETAALAMGIAGMPKARTMLTDLAMDRPAGRRLVSRQQVSVRTRSFAIYSLGLLAHRSGKVDLKRAIFDELANILGDRKVRDRNLQVAAIHAISILNLPRQNRSDKESQLIGDALEALEEFYDLRARPGHDLIKSHVPTAIAKLLGRGNTPTHQRLKDKFLKALTARKKRGNNIYRSAIIALGKMALPGDTDKSEARYSAALLKYFHGGRDQQARFFALMGLGQIGGNANRNHLRTVLRKGQKSLDRPWAGLSLGVMRFLAQQNVTDPRPDKAVGAELLAQFTKIRNPQARAALAVALGLGKYQSAAPALRTALTKHRRQDEFAGYLCLGLALMDEKGSRDLIHQVVRGAVRRPALLRQAAISLGKLGDRSVADTLISMMAGREPNLAKLSAIATALGLIGDRRTIKPLKDMLFDDQLTSLSRAFAAVALGGVADKEMLPWGAKLSRDMNYRAAVETLTQSGTGVLDIL